MVLSLVLSLISLTARAQTAEPVWFARDGGWCEPGRWFRGGPCADGWPGEGPGVPSAPDPYRDPHRRDPRWDPRPRPAPRPPLPDSAFPAWWDWSYPGNVAASVARAEEAAYLAARAAGRPRDEREELALRDLYQAWQTALWFEGALARGFRADPWSTEEAYGDAVAVYRAAMAGLAHARVPRRERAALETAGEALRSLLRYYEFRPSAPAPPRRPGLR